jgi:hypothetical protein
LWATAPAVLTARGLIRGEDVNRATPLAPVPRILLTRREAAAALGRSLNTFERYVQPHLRLVRLGRMRLVPLGELRRWAHGAAEATVRGYGRLLDTSGATVSSRIFIVVTFREGKVLRYREFYDEAAALEAVGLRK